MKSPDDNPTSIEKLRSALDESNEVIEKGLRLHRAGSEDFATQKHEVVKEAFQAVVSVKNYIDSLGENINTMPLFRILEEWRNTFEGADDVILGHSNPDLLNGGRPKIAFTNEYNTLLIAAIAVLQSIDMELNNALKRVSHDANISMKELRNIRTRFSRKDRADNKYSDLARRLSQVPDTDESEVYYKTLIKKYHDFRGKWRNP